MNRQTIEEAARAFTITVLAIIAVHLYVGAWFVWACWPGWTHYTARERSVAVRLMLVRWPVYMSEARAAQGVINGDR